MSDVDLRTILSIHAEVDATEDETPRSVPWINAISGDNDLEMVRGLLENGASVNETLRYKYYFFPNRVVPPRIYTLEDGTFHKGTALLYALLRNNTEIAEMLINAGADVNATDDLGFTPLHHASELDCHITELLIEKGANANATNREGSTPLHLAIWLNNPKNAEMLMNSGADVNAPFKDSRTRPLHVASKIGCDIIELLIEKGANVNALDGDGLTPLHIALRQDNVKINETLIHAGADVNATDNYGFTSLHVSSWLHSGVADLLIEKGANVKAKDYNARSALHVALLWNNKEVAESLINAGANVNASDDDGLTPLHAAARSGCDIVQLLVEKGAVVNATDRNTYTPLHFALLYNTPTIAEILINSGAHIGKNTFYLKYSAMNGHENLIRRLLTAGATVNATDNFLYTALHWACKNGHLNCVQLLLERGASLKNENGLGQSPLDLARSHCHKDVVKYIEWWQSQRGIGFFISSLLPQTKVKYLQNKIDDLSRNLADKENTCVRLRRELDSASLQIEELLAKVDAADDKGKLHLKITMEAVRQKTDTIDLLHSQMAHIMVSIEELKSDKLAIDNKSLVTDAEDTVSVKSFITESFKSVTDSLMKKSSLSEAVTAGDEELVVRLLKKNMDLNMRGKDKQTSLFLACKYNRHGIVRLLIDRGADVNAANKDNATPLYAASENGYADVVEFLLGHKANVNTSTRNEASPLLIAAENGHLLVVEALLKKGARMNMAMKGGYTPLYVAARNDRREVVQMLLEHGADANASSDKGMSPLHRAAVEGYTEVMELLLEYGADVDTMNTQQDTADRLAEQHGKNVARDLIVCWRGMSQSERNSHTEMKRKEREEQKERLIQVSKCASSSDLVDLTVQLAAEEREMEELRDKARALNLALNTIPEEGDVSEVPLVEEIIQELVVRQERVSELRCGITKSQYVRNENVTKNFIIINQGVVHGTVVGNCRDIYVESQDNN